MFVDSDRKSVFSRYPRKYPRGESNPYQKFRKLLFYPLNYKAPLWVQRYFFLLKWQYERLKNVLSGKKIILSLLFCCFLSVFYNLIMLLFCYKLSCCS